MAYRCPVCDEVALDGEHLAHHLAIVAMTRGGEHESWLDEHATGWRSEGPETLAALATEHAEAVDHEFHDAADHDGDRPDPTRRTSPPNDGRPGRHSDGVRGSTHGGVQGGPDRGVQGDEPAAASDETVDAVLRQAMEMTDASLRDGEEGSGERVGGHEDDRSGDREPDRPGDGAAEESETDSDE